MEKMDYWRFCDELTVIQAVYLIIGEDPDEHGYASPEAQKGPPKIFNPHLSLVFPPPIPRNLGKSRQIPPPNR